MKLEYSKKFRNYCDNIAEKYFIKVSNHEKQSWYYSIFIKSWKRYKSIYSLVYNYYEKKGLSINQDNLVSVNFLTEIYKINIRLVNTLFRYTIFIEESLKSWLYYKDNPNDYDADAEISLATIGVLIQNKPHEKHLTTKEKREYLDLYNSQKFNNTDIEEVFRAWKDIRNYCCHKNSYVLINRSQIFAQINKMLLLMNCNARSKACRDIYFAIYKNKDKTSGYEIAEVLTTFWDEDWKAFHKLQEASFCEWKDNHSEIKLF